jgi:flagellar motility protein MotE (MotC chaperone)
VAYKLRPKKCSQILSLMAQEMVSQLMEESYISKIRQAVQVENI